MILLGLIKQIMTTVLIILPNVQTVGSVIDLRYYLYKCNEKHIFS